MAVLDENHLHTYKRVRGSKTQYICTHPDCDHRNFKKYMVDKRANCPRCQNAFIIRRKHLRLANPHCDACTAGQKKKHKEFDKLMDEVLI